MSTLAPARQKTDHLNLALEHICYRLQLPDDQFNAARARYEEVGEWLTREGSPVRAHRPRVFHQGSMLLDTTVRPLRRAEYDLDVVCLLNPPAMMSPRQVFDLIWNRMRASPAYRDVVRPKPRCIRVDLPGKFHLDIVPAVSDATTAPTGLFIPDLPAEVGKWKASDPEGFAKWFVAQCLKTKGRVMRFSMTEASVDPIPDRQPYHRKRPLKRAVQLIKRWRDVRFHGTEELSTPSIVVTRLAADYYDGDARATDAVMGILDGMHAAFAGGRPVVLNPVNPKEVISEKWEARPESFEAFKAAVGDFRAKWRALPDVAGAHNVARALHDLFGDPAAEAVKESFAEIEAARARKTLHVSRDTRTLVPAAAPAAVKVREHTFYGD